MNIIPFIRGVAAVTASDTTILAPGIGLWVGTGGDVAVKCVDGSTATLAGVASGTPLPGQFVQVLATGTTASDLVALY